MSGSYRPPAPPRGYSHSLAHLQHPLYSTYSHPAYAQQFQAQGFNLAQQQQPQQPGAATALPPGQGGTYASLAALQNQAQAGTYAQGQFANYGVLQSVAPARGEEAGQEQQQRRGASSAEPSAIVTAGGASAEVVPAEGAEEVSNNGTNEQENGAKDASLHPAQLASTSASASPARATTADNTTTSDPPLPTPRPLSGPGSRQRWTPEEDAHLIQLVKELPPLTWGEIGAMMGRKGGGCGMRWYKVLRARLAEEAEASGQAPPADPSDASGSNNNNTPLLPSPSMSIGPSSTPSRTAPPPVPAHTAPAVSRPSARARKVISNARTGVPVQLATVTPTSASTFTTASAPTGPPPLLFPAAPPAAPPSQEDIERERAAAVNAGPHYLPPSLLVSNPPVPFGANTVLRGRRTKGVGVLEGEVQAEQREKMARALREAEGEERAEGGGEGEEDQSEGGGQPDGESGGKKRARESSASASASPALSVGDLSPTSTTGINPSSAAASAPTATTTGSAQAATDSAQDPPPKKKKIKKRGTAIHPCPAENCPAAFKRSEHLRRHYASVHRGEKPWPCTIEGCGKSFSRKDNLQQHQALVHYVRATYFYPSTGLSTTDPPSPKTAALEGVETRFEAVEVTRAAVGGDEQALAGKIRRARGKLMPTAAGVSIASSSSAGLETLAQSPAFPPAPTSTSDSIHSSNLYAHLHPQLQPHAPLHPPVLHPPVLPFSVAPSTASSSYSNVSAPTPVPPGFSFSPTPPSPSSMDVDGRLRLTGNYDLDGPSDRETALQMLADSATGEAVLGLEGLVEAGVAGDGSVGGSGGKGASRIRPSRGSLLRGTSSSGASGGSSGEGDVA